MSQRDERVIYLIFAQFTRFKISCSQKWNSRNGPHMENWILFNVRGRRIARIAIGKLPDCISVNESPSGTGTNVVSLRVPDVLYPGPQTDWINIFNLHRRVVNVPRIGKHRKHSSKWPTNNNQGILVILVPWQKTTCSSFRREQFIFVRISQRIGNNIPLIFREKEFC